VAWLAQYMESHGVEVDLRDHCGHSPLHLAARAGHASAVAILVAHGADVTAKVFLFSFFFQPIFELSFIFPISHPPQKLVSFILLFKKKFNYSNQDWFLFITFFFPFLTISFFFLFFSIWAASLMKPKGNEIHHVNYFSFFISNNLENISCVCVGFDLIPFKVIPDDPFFFPFEWRSPWRSWNGPSLSPGTFSLRGHNP
jgi:hypothetical protein